MKTVGLRECNLTIIIIIIVIIIIIIILETRLWWLIGNTHATEPVLLGSNPATRGEEIHGDSKDSQSNLKKLRF